MKLKQTLQVLITCGALSVAANADTIFNFDSDAVGTSTTFTDTVNSLSATFSSSADPGGFIIYSSMFDTLTGNVLGDPGPSGLGGLNLDISFSQDLASVILDFATADFGTASPLTITAYENSTLIGSATATGEFPNGFMFPEGEVNFAGSPFNQLVVSSSAPDFAVDNIDVVAAPEPTALALFALGLFALGIPALKRTFADKSNKV
jgi:hypothetical protein